MNGLIKLTNKRSGITYEGLVFPQNMIGLTFYYYDQTLKRWSSGMLDGFEPFHDIKEDKKEVLNG